MRDWSQVKTPTNMDTLKVKLGSIVPQKLCLFSIQKKNRLGGYVVVQFLLWNNLFLNWDKIVLTGTILIVLVQKQ